MNRRHFLAAMAGLSAAGCSPGASHRLVVGMELSYPPFEMTDEQGKPAGISVDLATELAKALGRELVIENMAFDGLIPALKTGKIDLVISSLTKTPERAESIAFSNTYLETGLCLLVGKKSPIQSASDLDQPGRKIAVKKGTTGHTYAAAQLKSAEVIVLDKESSAVLEVVQGKADAFIYDQLSVYQHWKRNEESTRAILQPFQKERWAIGARLGNTDLLESVDNFLSDFRQGGGFERLGEHWLKEQKDGFKKLGLVFVF